MSSRAIVPLLQSSLHISRRLFISLRCICITPLQQSLNFCIVSDLLHRKSVGFAGPGTLFWTLSLGSDSSSHRGLWRGLSSLCMAGKGKKGGGKISLFTFDSLVQALSAVGHWSDMVMSQVQSSKAIVHLVAVQ